MNKYNIESTITDVQETVGVTFPEAMSWDEFVEEQAKLVGEDKKLKALLRLKATEELVEGVSLDSVMHLNFMAARDIIVQMTLPKRIKILEEAHELRDYLYGQIGLFGAEGIPKDEQLSAANFRLLLGRVKHLEILVGWLYGLD